MSTAAGVPHPREIAPLIGHNAWWLQLSFNAFFCVTAFITLPSWVAFLIIPGITVLLWLQLRHDHSLCEKCITAMPLDPQTEIIRKDRWLRGYHLKTFKSRRSMYIFLILFLAGYIALTSFLGKPWSGIPVVILMGVITPLAVFATQFHKQLEPWCPYCPPDEDGGDFEVTPDPVPAPGIKEKV